MAILVTGGLGYIGSHITLELLQKGYPVIIVDNLITSKVEIFHKLKKTINNSRLEFFETDIRDKSKLEKIFYTKDIQSVIHCAGLKVISESIIRPLEYYDFNVNGTLSLCLVMEKFGVRNLIYSSSASIYDQKSALPIKETSNLMPNSVYGRTKLYIENLLLDLKNANNGWKILALRYFNPVSAHQSGIIGEIPVNIPTNLLPLISLVATGKQKKVKVFGNDYDTFDGTAIRDFIHVVDLAKGHIKAVNVISESRSNNFLEFINLGTGKGYTVLEMIKTFEKVNNVEIPYEIMPRRDGDISTSFADVNYANEIMSWKAKFNLEKICSDQWNFVLKHENYFK